VQPSSQRSWNDFASITAAELPGWVARLEKRPGGERTGWSTRSTSTPGSSRWCGSSIALTCTAPVDGGEERSDSNRSVADYDGWDTVASVGQASTWASFEDQEPVFAGRVKELLAAHPHHVVATVRQDGSPRVGGTNVFVTDGVLWIGMMPQAARVADLRRDPRCAIHSAPLDEHLTVGDVRLRLLVDEADPERAATLLGPDHPGGGVVFTLEVAEASLVRVEGEVLMLEVWRPGSGLKVHRLGE